MGRVIAHSCIKEVVNTQIDKEPEYYIQMIKDSGLTIPLEAVCRGA